MPKVVSLHGGVSVSRDSRLIARLGRVIRVSKIISNR